MATFYITFGTRYDSEVHPYFEEAHPNMILRVDAQDENQARSFAAEHLSNLYAFIYEEDQFSIINTHSTRGITHVMNAAGIFPLDK